MTNEINVAVDGEIATITIAREQRRNALDHHAVKGLRDAFADLVDSEVKAIVLTGEGTRSFCAGDDIKAYKDRTANESWAHFERGLGLMDQIANHPCLVIAAIEGYCMGGGLELALACDHRIASEQAVFALPEVRKLKANPSWGGMTRLPQLIGLAGARRLALMGEDWTAEQALAHGLIDQVVSPGSAVDKAQSVAREFAGDVDRAVVARAKRILNLSIGGPEATSRLVNTLSESSQPFEG
jgi:enoyl-CoA hydratase